MTGKITIDAQTLAKFLSEEFRKDFWGEIDPDVIYDISMASNNSDDDDDFADMKDLLDVVADKLNRHFFSGGLRVDHKNALDGLLKAEETIQRVEKRLKRVEKERDDVLELHADALKSLDASLARRDAMASQYQARIDNLREGIKLFEEMVTSLEDWVNTPLAASNSYDFDDGVRAAQDKQAKLHVATILAKVQALKANG